MIHFEKRGKVWLHALELAFREIMTTPIKKASDWVLSMVHHFYKI